MSSVRETAPPRGHLRAVAAFTFAYLLVASIVALERGNLEFVLYIAVILILAPLILTVHRRVALSAGALWCLSVWGLAHMGGGLITLPAHWPLHEGSRVLYSLWIVPGRLKYDHLVHAFGFGTTTWVCWQALRASLVAHGAPPRPTAGRLILVAAAGQGFGALNEVIEFAATRLMPETNVGGYVNTGWDLVANLVGATLAVTLIRLASRQHPDRIPAV